MKKIVALLLLLASYKTVCIPTGAIAGGACGFIVTAAAIVGHNKKVEQEAVVAYLFGCPEHECDQYIKAKSLVGRPVALTTVIGTALGAGAGTAIQLGIQDLKRNGVNSVTGAITGGVLFAACLSKAL